MRKLPEVEEARRVLAEGMSWSIWGWLFEKRRVRTIADAGTAALDALEKEVKAGWSDDLKKAYREVEAQAAAERNPRARRQYEKAAEEASGIDPDIKLTVRRVKELDDRAREARLNAEAAFEEAERHLSGSRAREAAEMAINAYGEREKAIRRAEAAARLKLSAESER